MKMDDKNQDKGKEYRRYLYQKDREQYKKERKKFVFEISKTFKNIHKAEEKEMKFLDEQTKLATEYEENERKGGSRRINILIRREKENEYFIVENVTRKAFWNVYKPGCDEHLMVKQLRQSKDFIPELDLLAEHDGKIVGSIICSKCLVVNDENPTENSQGVIAIGPIGVLPEYQKQGIGSLLIEAVKEKAAQMGFLGIVLYGNPQYYHRFGFVNAENYGIRTPENINFEDFMALELSLGSLQNVSGRCYESEAFEIDKNDLNEFEKCFTQK